MLYRRLDVCTLYRAKAGRASTRQRSFPAGSHFLLLVLHALPPGHGHYVHMNNDTWLWCNTRYPAENTDFTYLRAVAAAVVQIDFEALIRAGAGPLHCVGTSDSKKRGYDKREKKCERSGCWLIGEGREGSAAGRRKKTGSRPSLPTRSFSIPSRPEARHAQLEKHKS